VREEFVHNANGGAFSSSSLANPSDELRRRKREVGVSHSLANGVREVLEQGRCIYWLRGWILTPL